MRFGALKRTVRMLPMVFVLLATPAPGTAAEPARTPQFERAGVVKSDGASFALLKEPQLTGGQPVLLRQGQSIGEYRLLAVEEDRVLLESSTGVITVPPAGSKSGPDAVAVVPARKPNAEARPAPSGGAEAPANTAADALQKAVSGESTMTAEESANAALKGTPGGKVLDILRDAFGLGTKPE